MATESGVEGFMKRDPTISAGSFCYRVSQWTLESNPHLQEDTNACTGGHSHRSLVKYDHKVTASIFVGHTDVAATAVPGEQPEVNLSGDTLLQGPGMIEGNEITLSLRVGTLNGYNNWLFTVDTVTLKGCDANGLVQYEVVMYSQAAKPVLAIYNPGTEP